MTGVENELKYQRVRVLVATAVLAVFLVNMVIGDKGPRAGFTGVGLVLGAAALVSVGAFAAAVYLPASFTRLALGGYAVSGAAAIGVYVLAPQRPGQIMLFLVIATAATRLPMRESAAIAIATIGGYTGAVLATGKDIDQLWTVVGMVGMYAAVIAGQNRKRTRRIEQENLVLAERGRIAREIHDILAHTLSAQLVHLEGAKLLVGAGRTDEAVDRIERARELARGGLSETRRALDTLRGENLKVDEALRELAAQHHEAGGGNCEVTVTGPVRQLSAQAGLAVVRTAQEALTNVRKHATGADVTIDLHFRADDCELAVADTGGDAGTLAATGSGYGLVGMRERAELIGGTLAAGPRGDGFAVVLRVPS